MSEVNFTIECKMEERWVPQFLSFLDYMQYCGNIGHSALIGFFADGDGDFRPNFKTDIEYKHVDGIPEKNISQKAEYMWDAR